MKLKTVYFAGKVKKGGGYRQKLLSGFCMSTDLTECRVGTKSLIYGGPSAISCDHGCFHDQYSRGALHGCGSEETYCVGWVENGVDPNRGSVRGGRKPLVFRYGVSHWDANSSFH